MERIALEQKVIGILNEQLGFSLDDMTIDAKLIDDLGADSLDTIELVIAFEEAFEIEIEEAEAEKLVTVGDVVNFLEKKVA